MGGATVSTQGLASTTTVERSLSLSTVTVYNAGTVTLTTIYSDASATPQANPFTVSATGAWSFYVLAGLHVDIKFSGTGVTSPFTLGDMVAPASSVLVADVKAFGAKGDVRVSELASMSASSSTLTCSDAAFSAADIGKHVDVNGAGAQTTLSANVVSRTNATTIVISTAASFTLTNQTLTIRGATYADCATTAGSTTVTSATAVFTAADVGHPVTITLAGRWNRAGTIVAVTNSTTATLSFTATGAVSGKRVIWGTDDSAAINLAYAVADVVYFPAAKYAAATFAASGSSGFDIRVMLKVASANKTFLGDANQPSAIYSIGPLGSDASTYGTIAQIMAGASHTRWRYLSFKGTNALGQAPTTGVGASDGVFIDTVGLIDDTAFEYCSFDNFWLIGMHNPGISGDVCSSTNCISNITVDHCEASYNGFDGFNPSNTRGLRLTNSNATYNGTGGFEYAGTNTFVQGNYAAYNRSVGISAGGLGSSATEIKNNVLSDNIVEFNFTGISGANLPITVVTDNIASRNYYSGIDLHTAFSSTDVKHGIIKNNIALSNGCRGATGFGMALQDLVNWDVEGNYIKDASFTGYSQGVGINMVNVTALRILRNNVVGHAVHDYISSGSTLTYYNEIAGADTDFSTSTVTYVTPTFNHIISGGTAPTPTAQAGLGTAPTVAIAGNDLAGTITLTVGTTPGGGAFLRITFGTAFTATPRFVMFPASATAAAVVARVYTLNYTTTFVDLADTGAGLTAGQQYIWHYVVMQ